MKKSIIFVLFAFLLSFFSFLPRQSENVVASATIKATNAAVKSASAETGLESSLSISAKSALLLDYDSGTVVYEKNADEKLPIASMTKLCSLSLILDAIKKGAIKASDMVTVSETAAAVGGSSAFLDAGASYKVTDLIKTIVIASANDSTVALAEYVAGSEEVFVSKMNKLAKSLGLNNTNFVNSTGLPASGHVSTARDMAEIYRTVCNDPIYKKYSKIWMEDFVHPSGRKTGLVNTNRLIRSFEGIDGGKTGYTDSARFCLTCSATRGNTRFIAVVIGASDSKTRFKEASELLNFGFANYESKLVLNSDIPIAVTGASRSREEAEVFATRNSVQFNLKAEENNYTTTYQLDELKAPIMAGDVVGYVTVLDESGNEVDKIELTIKKDILPFKFGEAMKLALENW